ncbi:MAG: RidA family protein [Bryobacterales bacterium]|nr:RidA family protein [Bryobacterales bacterium]
MRLLVVLLALAAAQGAERRVITTPGGVRVGPYSLGILAGDYLYVSGQGAIDSSGRVPAAFDAQARLTLDNVKSVVEAAGLTMEHVVYTQVYLADLGNLAAFDRVWAGYFAKNPPARATLGVARMPVSTPVEVTAVAIRDLAAKRSIDGAVVTGDRIFLGGIQGRGADAAAQVEDALARAEGVLRKAGASLAHLVFVNPYLTASMPMEVMNRVYARRFEFGYTPARATIRVASLPQGASFELTGVAVRDLRDRRVVRPKNMPPSPTASPCVFAADTLYCSAKSAFIPGPNSGIYASTVEHQVRQTMRNLLDGLEEAGLDFSHVVATNVYLDTIDEFPKMNATYSTYFGSAPPTRTTVQPLTPVERKPDDRSRWPMLEQISLIAVK